MNHRVFFLNNAVLAATYFPRAWAAQVSSALKGLTAVFGMRTGVTLSQEPPRQRHQDVKPEVNGI